MQKDLKNITDSVMSQIHSDKIKMRPRMYFVIGSTLTFVGLVSSIVSSIFFVGLMRFFSRSHGPMGSLRLDQILSSFPWWTPVLAVVALIVGIWLLRLYDFSLKVDFKLLVAGLILAVIVSGVVIDFIGLNDALFRRGPMKGMMRQYLREGPAQDMPGFGRYKLP
jgi:hypothetical protein